MWCAKLKQNVLKSIKNAPKVYTPNILAHYIKRDVKLWPFLSKKTVKGGRRGWNF